MQLINTGTPREIALNQAMERIVNYLMNEAFKKVAQKIQERDYEILEARTE